MKNKYSFQGFKSEKMAKAIGKDIPISIKNSVMVCNAIRLKSVDRAKKILENVIEKKQAIKFTRFNFDRGHKKKMGPARFPVNTCKEILKVLKSAEANAHQKNLSDLYIAHISANVASRPWHYGRHIGRRMKRAHIEIVVAQKDKREEKRE
ncbi:MAG: 50S ribosomal protein L22 [Candidatus Woesearchaeota archaeon]